MRSGEFLSAAKKKGFDVYGIDIAPRNIEFIKNKRGIQTVLCGKIEDRVDDLGKFDIVTLFEVLEHVESPVALLNSIKKLLAPGGYFVMSTPNCKRFGGAKESWDFPPNHLFRWDANSLRYLLEGSSYTVEKMIEQVIGRDYLIVSAISSFGLVRRLRSLPKLQEASDWASPPPRTGDGIGLMKKLANFKNSFFLVLLSPLILVGKIIRLKYWDLYAVMVLNESLKQ